MSEDSEICLPATVVAENAQIDGIVDNLKKQSVMLVERQDRLELVGILTAFDLL
jgi:hypothetical protein